MEGTRAFVLNSPANPTGWTATEQELRAILEIVQRHGAWLVADEVYSRLIYDGRAAAPSLLDIAEPDDRVIVCNSFSKTRVMTGWRLGWRGTFRRAGANCRHRGSGSFWDGAVYPACWRGSNSRSCRDGAFPFVLRDRARPCELGAGGAEPRELSASRRCFFTRCRRLKDCATVSTSPGNW